MPYRADRQDRAKSFALVLAVHLALGAALLAGLRGPTLIRAAQQRLTTFAIRDPEPPPAPPAAPSVAAPARSAGAPAPSARPAPVIVPRPAVLLPTPAPVRIAAEPAPLAGTDRSAGAAAAPGHGNGAGGAGAGLGEGGAGGSGVGGGVGPRWLGGGLSRRDYRDIRAFDVPSGSAAFTIRVDPSGRAIDCFPARSSGSPALDAAICDLLLPRMAFEPARDPSGRPASGQVTYVATWSRR